MPLKRPLRYLTEAGLTAALYVALTLLFPSLAFGTVQVRFAEVLTMLPVLTPAAIPGLTVGWFLSNLLGLTLGANVAGAWDLLFGTGATLLAALLTHAARRVRTKGWPLIGLLPPILCNALIVGAELTWVLMPFTPGSYALFAASVAAGQAISCSVGMALCVLLEKSGAAKSIGHSIPSHRKGL